MNFVSDSYGGGSADWTKAIAHIKYSYLIELRDGGTHGFLLPPDQITPTGQETWAGIHTIAKELIHKYVKPTVKETYENTVQNSESESNEVRNTEIEVDIVSDKQYNIETVSSKGHEDANGAQKHITAQPLLLLNTFLLLLLNLV